MTVNKKTMQRITIGIIALTMVVGTLGAYFVLILQNDSARNAALNQNQEATYPDYPVDETAYKVEETVDKLQIDDLIVGTGDEVKLGDTVRVHYKGTFAQTGQKFDSSYDGGEPVTFELKEGNLIEGWTEGMPGMKVGGKRRLIVPSDMAYGPRGYPGSIPPNTDLVFEIELLAVNP